MSSSPQYLSTAQASERLGISREHVRRLIQRGELRAEETVNGFMVNAFEVDQYAIQRQVLQDQRQFRAAVDDLATQARRVGGATGIQNAVAQVRDQMKQHPIFEVPGVVAPYLRRIEQEVAAQKALAVLAGPAETIKEQWRRYDEDARRAMGYVVSGISADDKMLQAMNADGQQALTNVGPDDTAIKAKIVNMQGGGAWEEELRRRKEWEAELQRRQGNVAAGYSAKVEEVNYASAPRTLDAGLKQAGQPGYDAKAAIEQMDYAVASPFGQRNSDAFGAGVVAFERKQQEAHRVLMKEENDPAGTVAESLVLPSAHRSDMPQGFVVPEPRETRLEEKVDELGRKVEQLTELVLRQRADTTTETPTWQEWAGSDRPEDVLAKLDAVRAEVTGGKRMPDNSTDIIRAAREARGQEM